LLDILLVFHRITPLHLFQRFISAPAVDKWSSPVPEGFRLNFLDMKSYLIQGICLLFLAGFSTFSLNAATGGGSGRTCGYTTFTEPCQGSNNQRTKCKAVWDGTASCTMISCDGSTIDLGGPLHGCENSYD
jgi:hypothetical protein